MNTTRRGFIAGLAGLLAGCKMPSILNPSGQVEQSIPLSGVPSNRIIRAYNRYMNEWDFSTGHWADYNDITEYDRTFRVALKTLTGKFYMDQAWGELLTYTPGDKFTIKLNHNNVGVGGDDEALPNTSLAITRAVVSSLVYDLGVPQENITIFDVVRDIPVSWWRGPWADMFPGVEYIHKSTVIWNDTPITFPNGAVLYMPQHLVDAQHLINIPLMKGHGSYLTGGMKNHFGTIERPDWLHIDRQRQIAFLNSLPDTKDKTRLVIVEAALQTYTGQADMYTPYQYTDLFPYGKCGSLIMATNSFATDNVLADLINQERAFRGDYLWPNEFLTIAQNEYILGTRETATIVNGTFSEKDLHYDNFDYNSFDVNVSTGIG